jgi:hypothetical protein
MMVMEIDGILTEGMNHIRSKTFYALVLFEVEIPVYFLDKVVFDAEI